MAGHRRSGSEQDRYEAMATIVIVEPIRSVSLLHDHCRWQADVCQLLVGLAVLRYSYSDLLP